MIDAVPALVTDEELADLVDRVRRTRLVPNPWGADANRGIRTKDITTLLGHWGSDYDWRRHEARIRALPWVVTGDGPRALRLIHQPSATGEATTTGAVTRLGSARCPGW